MNISTGELETLFRKRGLNNILESIPKTVQFKSSQDLFDEILARIDQDNSNSKIPRVMVVMEPVKIRFSTPISKEYINIAIPNENPQRASRFISLESEILVDKVDLKDEITLKYACRILINKDIDERDENTYVSATIIDENTNPQSTLNGVPWIPASSAMSIEVQYHPVDEKTSELNSTLLQLLHWDRAPADGSIVSFTHAQTEKSIFDTCLSSTGQYLFWNHGLFFHNNSNKLEDNVTVVPSFSFLLTYPASVHTMNHNIDDEISLVVVPTEERRSSISNIDDYSYERVTLLQQKELQKLKIEAEKRARFAEIENLKQIAQSNIKNENEATVPSVKGRFETAKINQQKNELARLEQIKKAKGPIVRRESASMKDLWNQSITEAKANENNRYQDTKLKTIASFRVTDGTGFVKRRISEWEELFMQIAASIEQLEDTIKAALEKSEKMKAQRTGSLYGDGAFEDQMKAFNEQQRKFRENGNVPESFTIGDTHIYPAKYLDNHIYSQLKKILIGPNKPKHYPLSCGVYGNKSSKPPVEVYATAMKTDESNIYIAITIKAVAGHELDKNVFGERKVSVFDNNSGTNYFDRIFDITPIQGWEEWIEAGTFDVNTAQKVNVEASGAIGNRPRGETEDRDSIGDDKVIAPYNEWEHDESFFNTTKPKLNPGDESNVAHGDSADPDDLGNGTWQESPSPGHSPGKNARLNVTFSSESIDNYKITTEDLKLKSDEIGAAAGYYEDLLRAQSMSSVSEDERHKLEELQRKRFNSIDDEVDHDGEASGEDSDQFDEPSEPFNFGRSLSVAKVIPARSFLPANMDKLSSTSKDKFMKSKYSWNPEDEIDFGLPAVAQTTTMMFDLSNVRSFSMASNCLIIESMGDLSMIFTGTLKSATTDTKYEVNNDKIFEWTRGAAISGWITKWPMQSQQFGRPSRRFFILRDHLLTYYKTKPKSEEEAIENYSLNTMHLTDTSTIEITRYYFTRCLKISTPLDILWLRCTKEFKDENRWLGELKIAIHQQSRKKIFLSKLRVESNWHHESPNFSLVCTDSFTAADKYVISGLFCLKKRKILDTVPTMSAHDEEMIARYTNERLTMDQPAPSPVGRTASFSFRSSFSSYTRFTSSFSHQPPTNNDLTINSPVEAPSNPQNPIVFTPLESSKDWGKGLNEYSYTYSIDIGTHDAERTQFEILDTNESPELDTRLYCVKIYGEFVIFGGSNGFIGIGVMGRLNEDELYSSGVPRKVMFCIPCKENDSETEKVDAVDPNDIPFPTSWNNPDQNGVNQIDQMDSLRGDHDISVSSPLTVDTTLSIHPAVEHSKYPHSKTSTVVSIAVGLVSSIFVSGDSEGILGIWHLEKSSDVLSYSKTPLSQNQRNSKKFINLRPKLLSTFALSSIDLSGHYKDEKIIKLYFLAADSFLIASTNKRLLLFNFSDDIRGKVDKISSSSKMISEDGMMTPDTKRSSLHDYRSSVVNENFVHITGWVELDRVIPGTQGVFGLHIEEKALPAKVGSTSKEVQRKIVQWKVITEEDPDDLASQQRKALYDIAVNSLSTSSSYSPTSSSGSTSIFGRRRVASSAAYNSSWSGAQNRILSPPGPGANQAPSAHVGRDGTAIPFNTKCKIYRFEWTEEMFDAVLMKLKPL